MNGYKIKFNGLDRLYSRYKTEFDKIDKLKDITHIIIENQISPIATRMKTIQGLLTQYFIMKYNNAQDRKSTRLNSSHRT